MADKLVELGVSSVSAVYNYPPPPAEGEEAQEGTWTASVSVQGNPFEGEGKSLDEAVKAAVEGYEKRGEKEEEPAGEKPTAKASSKPS